MERCQGLGEECQQRELGIESFTSNDLDKTSTPCRALHLPTVIMLDCGWVLAVSHVSNSCVLVRYKCHSLQARLYSRFARPAGRGLFSFGDWGRAGEHLLALSFRG